MSEGPWTVLERIAEKERLPCSKCEHVHEPRQDPEEPSGLYTTWGYCVAGCPRHTYDQMSAWQYAKWFLERAAAHSGDLTP